MGADLYIMKMRKGNNQFTGFRSDNSVGYWRDAYNPSNLLWQFELSYWQDIKRLTKGTYEMKPEQTEKFLKLLKSKEDVFEKNMKDLLNKKNKQFDYSHGGLSDEPVHKPLDISQEKREEWVAEFRSRYEEFKKFLEKAIELDSVIDCSV